MSDSLFQTTVFALGCLLCARLYFKAGLYLQRQRRYVKDSRAFDYLGISRRSFDFEGCAIAIFSGIAFAPFLPIIMSFISWRRNEADIFNWVGWASISIIGFLSFLWGLFQGKIYIEQYWEAVESVRMEDVVTKGSEYPYGDFSKFQGYVLDLIFRGVNSTAAIAAAKECWRYS